MPEKIEIYIKPVQCPSLIKSAGEVRIYYAGQWVDFREGQVVVRNEAGESLADAVRHYFECIEMDMPGYWRITFNDNYEGYKEWCAIMINAKLDLRRLAGIEE